MVVRCDVNGDACNDADDGDGTCRRNGDAGDGGNGDTMTTYMGDACDIVDAYDDYDDDDAAADVDDDCDDDADDVAAAADYDDDDDDDDDDEAEDGIHAVPFSRGDHSAIICAPDDRFTDRGYDGRHAMVMTHALEDA